MQPSRSYILLRALFPFNTNLKLVLLKCYLHLSIVFIKLLEISSETTSYKICNQHLNNNKITRRRYLTCFLSSTSGETPFTLPPCSPLAPPDCRHTGIGWDHHTNTYLHFSLIKQLFDNLQSYVLAIRYACSQGKDPELLARYH